MFESRAAAVSSSGARCLKGCPVKGLLSGQGPNATRSVEVLAIEPLEDRRLLSAVERAAQRHPHRAEQPWALAFDSSGNLYVANDGNNTVSKFAPGSTTPSATYSAGLSDPVALAFDSSGNLYVANDGNNTVSEFAPGSTTPSATYSPG